MTTSTTRCGYCRQRIHQQRNGAWYHNHNASVSCRPGEGSDRRAFPLATELPTETSRSMTCSVCGEPVHESPTDWGANGEAKYYHDTPAAAMACPAVWVVPVAAVT